MLKIVLTPNNILLQKVQSVIKIDSKIKQLVYDMEETLIAQVDPQGVGLAAPQVGISLSLFIIKPSQESNTEVFINPKILEIKSPVERRQSHKKKHTKLEGCLSVPRIWGPISRAPKIRLTYQDLNGIFHTKWFTGFKAVIIQHECDHLKGILFTQRALEEKSKLYEEKDGELHPLQY
jgi:peptide deformylase